MSRARSEQAGARELPCQSRQSTNGVSSVSTCVQHRMKDTQHCLLQSRTYRALHNSVERERETYIHEWLVTIPHIVGLIPSVPGHRHCLITPGCQSNKLIHLQTVGEILLLHVQLFTAAFHETQKFPGCPHSIRDTSLVEHNVQIGFFSNCNHTLIV